MTTGQRIAQKRKELGLSQEALGEKLGVSRQSIYKWESDAALPEIDKLITLSRLFCLSVGALLGVEEEDGGDGGVGVGVQDGHTERREFLMGEVETVGRGVEDMALLNRLERVE